MPNSWKITYYQGNTVYTIRQTIVHM